MSIKLGRFGLLQASVLVLSAVTASCGDDPVVETPTPKITTFTATPMMVAMGGTVTLNYKVTDAKSVKIDIMGGANVLPSTSMLEGSRMSPELTANTTFILTATNDDKTATRMVTVMVEGQPPMRAVINSFTANPTSVNPGDNATLSWTTMNAVSGTIRQGATELTTIDAAMLASGSFQVDNIQAMTVYTLAVKGADEQEVTLDVTINLNGPTVTSFTATPAMITAGDSSVLAWNVANATNVRVTGATSGQVYDGTDTMSMVTVMPAATEVFTLLATGAGNQMATQNVTVTVTAPMTAEITSFTASPSAVNIGEVSTLAWDVLRAPGGIEISTGGTVVHTNANAMGTFDVTPAATTTYTLRAINPAGDDTQDVTVTINPSAPAIIAFTAMPELLGAGGMTTLDWTTLGATSIDIEANGTNVYNTTTDVDTGTTMLVVNDLVTTFTLIATNADGSNSVSVRVVAHSAPVIDTFTVEPAAVLTNDPVTITWAVRNANELLLNANGMPVATFPTVSTGTTAGNHSGSITVNLSTSTTFELIARSAAGEVRATAFAATLVAELEPNNTSSTAIPLTGDGSGVNGNLTAGDEDWYSITVPEGGHVVALTSDGAGSCPVGTDTILTLIGPDGTTELAENDDIGGGNFCSRVDGRVTPSARDLPAGTYFIRIVHYSPTGTGAYTLTVTVGAPACGNSVLDRRGTPPEQCDDGNVAANDGCSATCTAEAQGVLAGPNAESTFTGALDPGLQVDFYQVTMPAEGYIRAETFAPAAPDCTGADTLLRLYDAMFVELGVDDNDGVSTCSLINPLVDPFSHVQAGTYWVAVESRTRATIAAYSVLIRALPYGCGNGIIEGMEQCDDGNNVTGDGCDVSCMFEGIQENEVGGNNTFNGAGVLTTAVDETFAGSITPAADVDFWAVTVPDGYHLDAYVTVNSLTSCPVGGPRGQLQLVDTDGATQLASNSTGGPDANCGRISPLTTQEAFAMTAGTYYLRVRELSDDETIANYYLHVRIVAPGCANGFVEGMESCDDGNTTSGDGCSATCAIEPDGTFNAPGAPMTFVGAIEPVGDLDYYQVVVTGAAVYIDAETFESASTQSCATADTVLALYDSTFLELGSDDEGGVLSCSHIVRTAAYARLEPGTYYISVEDYLNNGTIPAYELVVQAFPVDVCGNGVIEPALNERCDDGNTAAGDGCSATCIVEPVGVFAAPGGPQTFAGSIGMVGEVDYYQIDVTGGPVYIDAETFENAALATCPSGLDTVVRVFDSMFTQLGEDDEGGIASCSHVLATAPFARLEVGTYYVSVEDWLNNATIPAYELVLQAIAADICGNGITETGEICDDSNTTPGDGCSATCQLEIHPTIVTAPGQVVTVNLPTATSFATVQVNTNAVGQAITVTAGDPGGLCDVVQTGLNFGDAMFQLLGQSFGNGPTGAAGTCAAIRYPQDTFAANLATGTYYVLVFAQNGGVGNVELNIGVVNPICGNGFLDSAAGEACDDGNTTSGDGCSAACANEILVTLPGPSQIFSGAIAIGELDSYTVTVTAEMYLKVETFAPTLGVCPTPGNDTLIRLRDSAGTQLGSDDQDGIGNCSLIRTTDTFARLLPGTYTVTVEEFGLNAAIAAYVIQFDGYPVNVCGNTVIETALGEVCDDGNANNGDGCSSTCGDEGVVAAETEPNDSGIGATSLGTLGPGSILEFTGALTPAGDNDWYTFTLTGSVRARMFTFNTATQWFTSCPGDTVMWLYNAIPTNVNATTTTAEPAIIEYDDDDNNGLCSLISGTEFGPTYITLGAGTYYWRIKRYPPDSPGTSTLASYRARLEIVTP